VAFMEIEKIDTSELVRAICFNYDKEVFTIKELMEILLNCNFTTWEARRIIRKAFKEKNIGRVSYRQIKGNFVGYSTLVVLRKQGKKEDITE